MGVLVVFVSSALLAAGGSLNKWFLCNFQSSIPTSKTDAIQSIHYQSTVDAIRVSQQPLNVYQGQLRPIKPIRHHNVSRHSDGAEHIMRLHWREVVNGLVVTEQTTIRKSPLPLISVSFILFTHLQSSNPTPPPLHHPVCRHSFGIMLHVQANCAAKGIISVHCRQPVNQSSLCHRHSAPNPPRQPPASTHPGRLFPSAHLQCASRAGSYTHLSSSPLVWPSWPHWAGAPYGFHWLARQPVTQCGVQCRLASLCSQQGWYWWSQLIWRGEDRTLEKFSFCCYRFSTFNKNVPKIVPARQTRNVTNNSNLGYPKSSSLNFL